MYGIDLGLIPYQGLTRDIKKVRRAIEEFGNRATSQFGATREQRRDLQERIARSGSAAQNGIQAAAGGGPGAAGAAGNVGGAVADQAFQEMQRHSLEAFDALERDQQGYSTANALMAVVSGMRTLPGRKAVVFFSEGLSIPPNAKDRFLAVVAAANRANVSIYSVDAAGLRTESPLKETREEIPASRRALATAQSDVRPHGANQCSRHWSGTKHTCNSIRTAVWDCFPTRQGDCSLRIRMTSGKPSAASTATFAITTCSVTCRRTTISTASTVRSASRSKRPGVRVYHRKVLCGSRTGRSAGPRLRGASAGRARSGTGAERIPSPRWRLDVP